MFPCRRKETANYILAQILPQSKARHLPSQPLAQTGHMSGISPLLCLEARSCIVGVQPGPENWFSEASGSWFFSFSIDFAPATGQALLWALGKHSSKQSQAPCSQGPGILAGDPMPISAPVVCSQGACLLFPNQESCRALCWAPTAAFVGTLLTLF